MATEEEIDRLEDVRMPISTHVEELRNRLIYSIAAVILCFVVCWIFKVHLLDLVKRPHAIAMGKLGLSNELQVLSYQEGFYAYMKLCFIASLFLMYPFIIYQVWKFVSAGLYEKEKRYVLIFIPISYGAFVLGGLFGYFLLIPFGLQFLINILGPDIQPIITMQQYISFVFLLTIALGLVFQLPLVMLLLSKLNFVTPDMFGKWRKYSILVIFIIAAIVSPPDPFTQTMTATPMILLYELGILVAKPTKRGFIILGTIIGAGAIVIVAAYFYVTQIRNTIDLENTYGNVQLLNSESKKWKNITDKMDLRSGISLKTKKEERASFSLKRGIKLDMDANTTLHFLDPWKIKLDHGQIFITVEKTKNPVEIVTPNGRIRSKNGAFNIKTEEFATVVTAVKGKATLLYEGEEKKLIQGRQRRMTVGGDPVNIDSIIDWSEGITIDNKKDKK